MNYYAIIVAGGNGSRMQTSIPKQFLPLCEQPVLMHTLEKFYSFNNQIDIILVLPENQIEYWERLCKEYRFTIPHRIIKGGDVRFKSVKNGLQGIVKEGIVAIHDGVRPLVSLETLQRCFSVAELKGNAIPVIDVQESLRKVDKDGNFSVNRNDYKLVQTPQVFHSKLLIKSYQCNYSPSFTDDASVIEKAGYAINLVEGNRENIKITTPQDMFFAESLKKNDL